MNEWVQYIITELRSEYSFSTETSLEYGDYIMTPHLTLEQKAQRVHQKVMRVFCFREALL